MSSSNLPYTFISDSQEQIVIANKPTEKRSGRLSKSIRLGLGYGVVGLVIGYGASTLPMIRYMIMLAGRPPEDIAGWFVLLMSVSLFAMPVGMIGMIVLGGVGVVIGWLIYHD